MFCKDCHEFAMPAWDGGAMVLTDTPMQSTWSEWDDWRRAGGDRTCQGCHTRGGRRTAPDVPRSGRWRGAYHPGAEHDEGRGLVSLDELLFVLAEGALP